MYDIIAENNVKAYKNVFADIIKKIETDTYLYFAIELIGVKQIKNYIFLPDDAETKMKLYFNISINFKLENKHLETVLIHFSNFNIKLSSPR